MRPGDGERGLQFGGAKAMRVLHRVEPGHAFGIPGWHRRAWTAMSADAALDPGFCRGRWSVRDSDLSNQQSICQREIGRKADRAQDE